MKRYRFDRDLSEYYHWPICNCAMSEEPDGEWVRFSELPIITRKPETIEDVVAMCKVLYGPGWIFKDELDEVFWSKTVMYPVFMENACILPWAAKAFAGIAPEDSLTEVV